MGSPWQSEDLRRASLPLGDSRRSRLTQSIGVRHDVDALEKLSTALCGELFFLLSHNKLGWEAQWKNRGTS